MNGPPPPVTAPIDESRRQAPLDVLRGVAVLGILYMNIQSFSMPAAAYAYPMAYGDLTGVNFLVWLVGELFFSGKFIAIFSMLYGAGIVLLAERLHATGRPASRIHYRRNLVLLCIGLAHAHLLWSGDILFHYALCAMILYMMRRLPVRALMTAGVLFLLVSIAIIVLAALADAEAVRYRVDRFSVRPHPDYIAREIATFQGGWTEQQRLRFEDAIWMQTGGFVFSIFWWAGGLILIGMALYRTGFFSARWDPEIYYRLAGFGFLVGVPVTAFGVWMNFATGWDPAYATYFGELWAEAASPFIALAICSVVMLWCQMRAMFEEERPRTDRGVFGLTMYDRLAATGRMALTNYLVQTILCTSIFYGHGLGVFGEVERIGQLGIVVGIWALQLFWSPLWLKHFRFGPFEWIWRSLTYRRPQPLRRSPTPS